MKRARAESWEEEQVKKFGRFTSRNMEHGIQRMESDCSLFFLLTTSTHTTEAADIEMINFE